MSTPSLVSSQKISPYRSVPFQTVVVGAASFLAPGVYSALAATGAGGLASISVGNASLACAYALIIPSALVGSAFMGKFGHRWSLVIGSCGYAVYSAALYCNSAFGTQWFLIFGAVVCGLTSGIFWATEGTTILLYSEPYRVGRMLSLWQSIYISAPIIGGAINLSLNIDLNRKGGLHPRTYLVFVALNCVAPLVAALLSPAHKVQRNDGQKVRTDAYAGFWKEVWLTIAEMKHPRVIACSLLWSQSLFSPSFFSTYLAKYFTVRTRALGSLINPVMTIITFQIMGYVLDNPRWAARYRIVAVYAFIQVISLMAFIWLIILNKRFESNPPEAFDWTNNLGYAWAPYLLGLCVQHVQYGFYYYFASWLFTPKEGKGRLTRIIGTLRSAESGAASVAYGLNASAVSLSATGYINLAFSLVSIFAGVYVISYIWKLDVAGEFQMNRHHTEEEESSERDSVDDKKVAVTEGS